MPFRCCVPGCRGNAKGGPRVNCFSFPSNENMCKKWVAAIPRLNFVPRKTSRVCHLHFTERHIMRTTSQKDSRTGKVFTWDLSRLRLQPDAVPTIFSDSVPDEEEPVEVKEEPEAVEIKTEHDNSYSEFTQFDNYAKFLALFSTFESPESWFALNEEQRVIIFKLEHNPGPLTTYSVVVNANLKLETFLYGQEISISINNFKTPFTTHNLDQITELLGVIDSGVGGDIDNSNERLKGVLNHVTGVLGEVRSDESDRIALISEQLRLHTSSKVKYRYSAKVMIFSSIIYTISPHVYQFIRHSGFLILPHPQTIKVVCEKFPKEQGAEQKPLVPNYIRNMLKCLSGGEKLVILLINEIDVKPYLDYNRASYVAGTNLTTVYAFMIHSVYTNFREVVHISPTSRMNRDNLHNIIRTTIVHLEEMGYRVFCVVSNNSPISGKAMSNFAHNKKLSIVYPHPLNNNRPLFFLYDPVHLLKYIKCDWLHSSEQTFIYPDFGSGVERTAGFHVLKKLNELGHKAKFDSPLNLKDLFSTNLEIQDVHLAQKVFNPHVVRALLQIEENVEQSKDTADFISIILNWWNIVNDNALFQSQCSTDLPPQPIVATNLADPKLEFLEKMFVWLDLWKQQTISHRLTLQTYTALYHTIHGMLEVTRYCFEELKLNYVLLSKFQTDSLEHRFGKYRHLVGSQYTSIRQVYEAEKKLVIHSLPVLKSPTYGYIHLEKFYENIDLLDEQPDISLDLTISITEVDFAEVKDDVPVLTFLAGFCCYVILQKELPCEFCKERLVYPEELVVEEPFNLVKNMDEKDLLFPHDGVVQIVLCVFVIFNNLLENFEEEFFTTENGNKRRVISRLVLEYVAEEGHLTHFRGCEKHSEEYVASVIISWVTDTLLKNYYGKNRSGKINKKRKLCT